MNVSVYQDKPVNPLRRNEQMKKPYLTTEWFDEETGAVGYLVIDKMVDGFTAGGIRMREGLTKNEVQRLAEIMTIKMAGLEIGRASCRERGEVKVGEGSV